MKPGRKITLVTIAMPMSCLVTVSADGEETIMINTLGRTFTLGMLYDRRSDRIIPGKWVLFPFKNISIEMKCKYQENGVTLQNFHLC